MKRPFGVIAVFVTAGFGAPLVVNAYVKFDCISRRNRLPNVPNLTGTAVRLVARLQNATYLPSAPISGVKEDWLPLPVPLLLTLTKTVWPVCRSRTKTSDERFVSFGTRLSALLVKATKRPLPAGDEQEAHLGCERDRSGAHDAPGERRAGYGGAKYFHCEVASEETSP